MQAWLTAWLVGAFGAASSPVAPIQEGYLTTVDGLGEGFGMGEDDIANARRRPRS